MKGALTPTTPVEKTPRRRVVLYRSLSRGMVPKVLKKLKTAVLSEVVVTVVLPRTTLSASLAAPLDVRPTDSSRNS